jgi:signal transduction histidine kinase
MSGLAAGPPVVLRTAYTRVHRELAHAADLLQAPRVLMVWEESEEPWIHLAIWSHKGFDIRRQPPGKFEWLVAEPLMSRSFLCPDVHAMAPKVLYTSPTGLHHWSGVPLHPDIQAQFAVGAVLSSGVRGTTFEGRLFFLDMCGLIADDLPLADLIAHQVAANLDQFYLSPQGRQAVLTEECQRLIRTLHDGVLQSLTGISLQLTEVQRLLEEDPQTAREHLGEVERLIADEQRDLRFLIRAMKPTSSNAVDADLCLVTRLETVSRQIKHQWGLHIELNIKLPELRIPAALAYEIYYVVHEALVNAARHAHASTVHVELGVQHDQVRIIVCDNGHGFPFHGHYPLAALTNLQLGPVMLRERVAALGGALTLASSSAGARLDIRLPLLPSGRSGVDPTPVRCGSTARLP